MFCLFCQQFRVRIIIVDCFDLFLFIREKQLKHQTRNTKVEFSSVQYCWLLLKRALCFVQEHLACFLPGTLALGWMHGGMPLAHLELGAQLAHTCYEMYARAPNGLAGEITYFRLESNNAEALYIPVCISLLYM